MWLSEKSRYKLAAASPIGLCPDKTSSSALQILTSTATQTDLGESTASEIALLHESLGITQYSDNEDDDDFDYDIDSDIE